jgi:CheY-like chemotaxis protein
MSERILVVDDNPDTAQYTRVMLERQRYDVEVAGSGREALDRAAIKRPDLMLLDLLMPGLDGFAVLQALKSSRLLSRIPVVVFSARRARADVARAIEEGAADYVAKPIDADVLVAKVRSVLQQTSQTQEPEGEAVRFAECAVNEPGHLAIPGDVDAVSEHGVLFFTRVGFDPGQTIELSTPLFERLGIRSPLARIASRTPEARDGRPGFLYWMELVGLPEADRQRLRRHVLLAANDPFRS